MPKAKTKKSKYIFLFVRIAVIAAVVIWAISRIGQEQRWNNFVDYFQQPNFWVFFAIVLLIFVIGQSIIGLRWWLLLRTQSIFINLPAAVRLHFLGLFYNNFMPSSVGGDLIRAWYVTRHTEKKFEAALSVFVDRVIGLLSTIVIAGFFYVFFLQGKAVQIEKQENNGLIDSIIRYKAIIFWVFVVFAAVFLGFLLHKRGRKILRKTWSNLLVLIINLSTKFRKSIMIYCKKPSAIFSVFCLTVLMQMIVITGFWILGRNMGIETSLKYYYVFFTLTWVLGAIPVSIGGAGVVEAFLVLLFVEIAGTDEAGAWAIALCQRAVWMLASLPGAVIHLLGAHLPKDFFIDYDEPVA